MVNLAKLFSIFFYGVHLIKIIQKDSAAEETTEMHYNIIIHPINLSHENKLMKCNIYFKL